MIEWISTLGTMTLMTYAIYVTIGAAFCKEIYHIVWR